MVTLTRIAGSQFALNPDLIERVDRTPDTVITLVDGTKYLVQESLDEVVDAVLGYRSRIIAAAGSFERSADGNRRTRLVSVVASNADESDDSTKGVAAAVSVLPLAPGTP